MQISLYVCETKSAKSGLITCISSIEYLYYADHPRTLLPRSAVTCTLVISMKISSFSTIVTCLKYVLKTAEYVCSVLTTGNHIFVSVLIIYLRMTLTLFGNEAFPTVPITWVIPAYFGQQIVIKMLLISLSCKFKFCLHQCSDAWSVIHNLYRPQQKGKTIRWFITLINDHANWSTLRDHMPLSPAIIPSEIVLQHRVIDGLMGGLLPNHAGFPRKW